MQTVRMDRVAGLRHGGSRGVRVRRAKTASLRPEQDKRLRVRHGRGADCDDEVWNRGYKPALLWRYAISGAVQVSEYSLPMDSVLRSRPHRGRPRTCGGTD